MTWERESPSSEAVSGDSNESENTRRRAMPDYDAVVVGSGAGGMSAGLQIARAGRSVLVLEAAPDFGGCLSPLQRAGYSFDVGVHYIGELSEGDKTWAALNEIGLLDRVDFIELDPDAIDRYVFPDFELRLCKGEERFKQQLIELFPNEEPGIHQFFRIYGKVTRASDAFGDMEVGPLTLLSWILKNPIMLKYGQASFQVVLDKVTSDIRLQSALAAPWYDYMLSPEKASVMYGIGTWKHYLSGGFYPRGGSGAIRDAFVEALADCGADLKCSSRVKAIDRRSDGEFVVTSTDGQQTTASVVVSDVDPATTLVQLVNRELVPHRVLKKASRLRPSASIFGLFVGTDLDLGALGMTTGNMVHYGAYDINDIFDDTMSLKSPKLSSGVFFNSPTLRDPTGGLAPEGQASLVILSGANYAAFERWADLPPGERGNEHDAFVKALGDGLISTVEHYLPGLSQHLQFVEPITPLDFERRINLNRGGIYGPELTPDQMGPGRFPNGTCGIDGLFLAGAGTTGSSVSFCVTSGLQAGRKAVSFLDSSMASHSPAPHRS